MKADLSAISFGEKINLEGENDISMKLKNSLNNITSNMGKGVSKLFPISHFVKAKPVQYVAFCLSLSVCS